MLSTRRRIQKNQLKSIRRKQKSSSRTRNNGGPHGSSNNNPYSSMSYQQAWNLESQKDIQASLNISQNNQCVKFLTQDVEEMDTRMSALELKLNVFLRPDYEKLSKQYAEITDKIEELSEFRQVLEEQISTLNEGFKINIIQKFSDRGVVDSIKNII